MDSDRLCVHERDVTVGVAGGREEAFQFCISGAGVGLCTDEHGTARGIVGGEAHHCGRWGPGTRTCAPRARLGIMPVYCFTFEAEIDALLADGVWRRNDIPIDAGVHHRSAVAVVLDLWHGVGGNGFKE